MAKRKFKRKLKERGTRLPDKYPCIDVENCGSSDAMSVYEHDDGTYSCHCFACHSQHLPKSAWLNIDLTTMTPVEPWGEDYDEDAEEEVEVAMGDFTVQEVIEDFEAASLSDRKLSKSTLEEYGCRVSYDDDGVINRHFYPAYDEGRQKGFRIRGRFEEYHKEVKKKPHLLGKLKNFSGRVGEVNGHLDMFGSWLFTPEKHKRLFITEGEIDAMTGYQMSKMKTKNKQPYAFVSMPSGANVKGIRDNIRYINSFDEIYLCFDMDDAGNKLLEEALKILPVSKVRIMKVPKGFKDLNELWTHEDSKAWRDIALNAFWDAIWNSEKYCPAGVRSFSEGFEAMRNRDNVTKIPFPSSFGDLNELTYGGYAKGEITTIAAPSSVGKSIFTREMTYTAWAETEEKIGIIPLEDSYEEMMEMLCGVHLSEQINEIPYDKRDWEKIKKAHTELSEGNRIHIIDHQGAIDQDNLLEFIDFLVCGLGCGIVILDPITLALSKQETDEEEVLSEILRRVKRYKYAHVNVCHVRKNAGSSKANSEGGEISEEDIKGSGAYFQISMNNILLMRNKVHPNPIIKNTTKIKLSKCRRHGKSTGIAGYAYYNGETGRLERGTDPELLEQGYSEDDEVGFETN